jgi:hypothetical protein
MKVGLKGFKNFGEKHRANAAFMLVVLLLGINLVYSFGLQQEVATFKRAEAKQSSGMHYTGNPFGTQIWQGQLQSENITGMHWYSYLSGSLENRTDWLVKQISDVGTSFPGSPSVGQLYFRTDLGSLYFYNGTGWESGDTGTQGPAGELKGEQPYSYLVFINATATYVVNGTTGAIDYNGVDSKVIIQDALTAMINGGFLFITAGTYSVNGLLPNSYTTIWGEGNATKLVLPSGLSASESANIFYVNGKTNVEIAWMQLDGNQAAYSTYTTGNYFCGIKTANSVYCKFHNLYVHDTRRTGILFWGTGAGNYFALHNEVYECIFVNCNWDSMEVADSSYAYFHDCFSTGTSDVSFGIWECKQIVFERIVCWSGNRNVGSTNGHNGMSFDGDSPTTVPNSECEIVDCSFSDFTGENVLMLGGTFNSAVRGCHFYNCPTCAIVEWAYNKYCHDILVTNNIFEKCASNESIPVIYIQATTGYGGWIITDNLFDNTLCSNTGNYPDAISFENVVGGTIANNIIKNMVSKCVSLRGTTNNVIVSGNQFVSKGAAHLTDTGFRETDTADYNRLESNSFINITTPVTILGTHTQVHFNIGFVTETSGTQTVANGETVSHGLKTTPTTVIISARAITYGTPAVTFNIAVTARGTSTFTVSAYWTNGTAISTDAIVIDWYAIYKP